MLLDERPDKVWFIKTSLMMNTKYLCTLPGRVPGPRPGLRPRKGICKPLPIGSSRETTTQSGPIGVWFCVVQVAAIGRVPVV